MRSTPCKTEYALNGPPTLEHAPMEMHHLGSGICSHTRFSTGAIFSVTVPATIIRSAWRGDGRNTSAPNLAISNREVVEAIISIAQHASPNVSGQMALLRAQLNTYSTDVIMKFFSNRWSSTPISRYSPRSTAVFGGVYLPPVV